MTEKTNPVCDPETSLKLVSKGRIVTGTKFIEGLIQKFKLNYGPSHQIWESGQFENQAIKMLGLSKDNLYIGSGKANYKYNNAHYPTVGLWVNAAGNFGLFWYASSEAKKLYKVQRQEHAEIMQATERKIREGNFTWTCEYREASGSGRSSSSDRWQVDYRVVNGTVNVIYRSGRDGYSSMDVPYNISSSGKSVSSWKEDPAGTPLEESEIDFRCWYGNIERGCGNGAFHHSGNGVRWMRLIKELYPGIKIPGDGRD
jgi:hypothetical protein